MKKKRIILILTLCFCAICLLGCGGDEIINTPSINDIYQSYVSKNLPVDNLIIYNENSDPNNLMNKSGQYISKGSFAITTITQLSKNDPVGGTIEIFKTKEDAKKRKEYIDSIGNSMPILSETSMIIYDVVLIRINRQITNTEAQKYFDITI